MSLLLGARGLGALVGPLFSARWAGHSERRLRLGVLFGYVLVAIGYSALGGSNSVWVACLWISSGTLRRFYHLGFLDHAAATQHGRPFSRTCVFRRPRFLDVDHRHRRLSLWTFSGLGRVGESGGNRNGVGDAASGGAVGLGSASVGANVINPDVALRLNRSQTTLLFESDLSFV